MLLVLVNSINMFAQSSMKEAVDMTEVFDLPYKRTKLGGTGFGCMIDNSRNVVPNKLYTNVQCTEYMLADDYDTMPTTYAKFSLPDAGHTLVALELGGNIDNLTDELILVDKNYNVTDALVAKVYAFPGTIVKQYYINED